MTTSGLLHSDKSAPLAIDDTLSVRDGSSIAIPLIVESEATFTGEQPITVGIPWPRGVLTGDRIVYLTHPSGRQVPLQTAPLAHWPDRSVKWLLVDVVLEPSVGDHGVWTLEAGHDKAKADLRPASSLVVEESDQYLVIDTGPASFTVDRAVLAPILQAELAGKPLLEASSTRTVLVDARGRGRLPLVDRCEIETQGPVRVTVRLEGTFEGRRRDRLRFLARLSFFAGSPLVRIDLTLHNPRRAVHRGGLWDLGDPGSILFRHLSFQLGLGGCGYRQIHWTVDAAGPPQATTEAAFEIYQDSSGGENWASRNHVNRYGHVPCRFRGYRVRQESGASSGLRASPLVAVQGPAGMVAAAIPEFWQQFPKAIDVEGGRLNLGLFPGQFGDLFELQGGEQKSHTVWLHFSRGDQSGIEALRWVHRPALIHCKPEWYAGTGVIPYLVPGRLDPTDRYESFISAVVEGPRSFAARREIIDEFGWRHYGEIYADHEGAFYQGEAPVISHYNNQYDFLYGLLIQYFRTGDPHWLELANPLARHVVDIDIYHTREDRALYSGGMFWHTDHYRDAATSTHRAYSRVNCGPNRRAYGGGPCDEHNYTTGLLNYYYLTGSPSAGEAVLSLADWVVAMDDGGKTVLGLVDDGPTGWASCTTGTDYHGPGRGCGNSINALLDGWLLTECRGYLDRAEDLIRRAVHPEMDIAALRLLETESRWSYTVFLSVLGRYLSLKEEVDERDAMYAYARTCLLAFSVWMVDHEVPYFDRPEKLDYPTETWAAHEFRKANVLRLAAPYADETLQRRLIYRANMLAERAWSDLLRFESRHVARAVALLMLEGPRDSYWRRYPTPPMPTQMDAFDFGAPQVFVPQKRRVLSQLRTLRGTLRAFRGLSSVRRWRRFLCRQDRSSVSRS